MNYPLLKDLKDIKGKKVVVRFDYNVPVQDGKVIDDYRIKKSLTTLQYLKDHGARVIIIGHIEGGTDTFKPVYDYLKKIEPITFCQDCLEEGAKYIDELKDGEIILCENLRLYDGEKRNDDEFAKKLASLGDIFVNDAFSVSHRKHASVVGIPKYLPSYLGFQFEEEITNLASCFSPAHPFLFILGGAKFDTKLPLVDKFLNLADTIFVGGALANDIFKAKGYEVGTSLVADQAINLEVLAQNSKIMTPADVVIQSGAGIETVAADSIEKDQSVMDAGSTTLGELAQKISTAKHILWNGPLGNYEKNFKQPTLDLAKLIAEATKRGAKTILGGGDTLAAISELGLESSFSFVSTGGGAMLDYLANETLPGLEVLKKKK